MRHVILTCKNHPNLRWSCKEIAFTPGVGYNGARNIFFNGISTGKMHSDFSGLQCTMIDGDKIVRECSCPPSDLILAPEDYLVVMFYGKKEVQPLTPLTKE